jgi:biopolymer transport protein ExbD
MRLKRAESVKREVDMTPMIDCVFLLLIFFLIATDIKKAEEAANVRLPESVEALLEAIPKEPPGPIVVSIVAKDPGEVGVGTRPYWVLGQPLSLTELKQLLNLQAKKQYQTENGKQAIVRIRADARSELQQLQYALKACQEAKIIRVFIAAHKVGKISGN